MTGEPTVEQCTQREQVDLPDGRRGWACWYPQMGGYVGRAVAVPDGAGCFDVLVWHDGEFPFSDANPTELHHCDGSQFVEFGRFLEGLAA